MAEFFGRVENVIFNWRLFKCRLCFNTYELLNSSRRTEFNLNFFKNYCSFEKLRQILDAVFHQSVLKNSAVLLLSHLGLNIPYVSYIKGFLIFFHGNW